MEQHRDKDLLGITMNRLKHMKTFMLIVEEGNIARAARKLGITKAAASKQLIELENRLDVQLLTRTTRSLKLTDVGQLYYEALHKVFHALNEADLVITHTHEKPIGILKILSHRHFGEKYIVGNIKEFTDLYPELKLDLELADRFPDLEKENIDIVCSVGHEGAENLVQKKIGSATQVLCASPEYLTRFGMPKYFTDLKHHRYITHSFRNPDNVLIFDNQELYLDCFLRLNDAQAMLQCALQGVGIIKIYKYFVRNYLKSGQLIELFAKYRKPTKSIYMYYQLHKFIQIKIRVFIDFINKKVLEDHSLFKDESYLK